MVEMRGFALQRLLPKVNRVQPKGFTLQSNGTAFVVRNPRFGIKKGTAFAVPFFGGDAGFVANIVCVITEQRRTQCFLNRIVASDNAHSFACVLLFPKISQKRSSTLNDLLQATMLRIRATNRTIVGYVRCARFPQMQALASLFACGQPEGVHAAGGTASPRRAPEKKKNPIKSGSFFSVVVEMRGVEPLTS